MALIEDTWRRIEDWLTEHAPESLAQLGSPVTADDLALAGRVVGDLPPEYVALLRIHDGVDSAQYGTGIFGGFVLRSLAGALADRDSWRQAYDDLRRDYDIDASMQAPAGVRQAWWHAGWLPVAVNADDPRTTVFLDLDPAPGGTRGQLVRHVVENDALVLICGGVGAWLEQIAATLEGGGVTVARDGDTVVGLDWPVEQGGP